MNKEQENTANELSDDDLDAVAGGGIKHFGKSVGQIVSVNAKFVAADVSTTMAPSNQKALFTAEPWSGTGLKQ